MPKQIDVSSFECDCGHRSHFFENTIKEMKKMSMNKEVRLGDSAGNEHTIIFNKGEMVDIICPKLKCKTKNISKIKKDKYTYKQGQYLAFIYYYTKINGRPPSESDIQSYFMVTWPSIHQMVLTLEKRKLIKRTPGKARSIQLLISADELPKLK